MFSILSETYLLRNRLFLWENFREMGIGYENHAVIKRPRRLGGQIAAGFMEIRTDYVISVAFRLRM